jgi:IPT/TIG domain/Fibronectin type III domain/Calcineurin-like phosphoesterase
MRYLIASRKSNVDDRVWLRAKRLSAHLGLRLAVIGTLLMSSTLVLQPQIASATGNPVVVIAGDISCSPTDPNFNSGAGQPSYCREMATANAVSQIQPNYLLPGGDTQYTPSATYLEGQQPASTDFSGGYGASWGQLQNPASPLHVPGLVVRPTPGDHEYGDYNENNSGLNLSTASNYYSYFGGLGDLPAGVTQASNDFYSFNIPVGSTTWHIISLDSECAALPGPGGTTPSGSAAGCAAGSPEETFLQNDLAANQGACTIIHWHAPLNSTYFGYDSDYQAFWNDAAKYHVTLIVNGHDHDYERWVPMNAAQVPSASGVTQIIVGTGGDSLAGAGTHPNSNIAYSDVNHFGVLQLTLNATGADYVFQTVTGTSPYVVTPTDSGTASCKELSAPTVASISTTSGSAGTSVTITGTNLASASAVHFGSTAATITADSATSITATAPSGSGTVDVTVTTTPSGGTSATSSNDKFTYVGAPTVASISPTSGSAGTSVTITGTNLASASAVDFGSTAATITADSATSITATVPSGTGTVDVTVTTPSGGTSATSSNDQFTYVGAPTVTSISPTSGSAGTSVTITGTNLASASAVVDFGSTAATITADSATSITATAPSGSGTFDVTVTTPSGGTSATSSNDQFTYPVVNPPMVTSISPTSGSAGTSVTITGNNLASAIAVTFGSTTAATIAADSATSITIPAPSGTGTVDVRVITRGGISATSSNDQLTYPGAPTVTSISPTSGSAGTSVTINGTHLLSASAVDFGSTAATITADSATSITATAPSGTGTVDVTVTTPSGGTSVTSSNDQFTYSVATPPPPSSPPPFTPPTVASISPTSGSAGTSVTITGTNLASASAVDFGSTAATIIADSATSITATVPSGTGTVDVTVTTPSGGTSATSSNDQFTYVGVSPPPPPPPTLTPPNPPTNVRVNLGDGTIRVTWSPPTNTGGSPLTNYTVMATPKTGKAIVDEVAPSVKSVVLSHLKIGIAYTVRVTAGNSAGQSSGSTPITVVPLSDGGFAPAPIGLKSTVKGTRTIITWSAPPNDGGFAITGYQVGEAFKKTATGGKLFDVMRLPASKRTYVLINVPKNFSGYFCVAAINAKGVGTREWLRLH